VSAEELLAAAQVALERYVEVLVDPDGALAFVHAEVPCAVQSAELTEGLVVLSMTCVLLWDLERTPSYGPGQPCSTALSVCSMTGNAPTSRCAMRSPVRGWPPTRWARC